MKKRLLITSIVMMLVVAVALSTATYAWFTSNQSVTASTLTLRAAVSNEAALGIGWTGSKAASSIVSDISQELQPMAPDVRNASGVSTALALNQSYEYADGNVAFTKSTIKEEGGIVKFNGNGVNQEPVVYTQDATKAVLDDANTVRSFYVRNLSNANTISSIKVSAVFPGIGDTIYRVKDLTETTPDQNKKYYVYVNSTFIDCSQDANYTIGATFDPDFTYYVEAGAFIPTKDVEVNVDRNYYAANRGSNSTLVPYVRVEHANIELNAGVLKEKVVTGSGEQATTTYYDLFEELTGNDMIRVALYTKEYRLTTDSSVNNDSIYYYYNPTTNLIEVYTGASAGDEINNGVHQASGYKLYETNTDVYYVKTADTGIVAGKKYYTVSDSTFSEVASPAVGDIANYYEKKVGVHKLAAVLAEKATYYTKATVYDINEVYYTITPSAGDTIEEEEFVTDGTLYTQPTTGKYVAVTSGTWGQNTTYYTLTATRVENPSAANIENYYTASYTVANGQIKTNGAVKDLNYFTGVTADHTFAQNLKPGEQVDIIAVIWLDGTALDDTRAAELAQVSLLFETNEVAND